MTTPDDPATPLDFALVKDGVVGPVVRWPVGPETFGPEPDGEVLPFAPSDRVCEGMLWDGAALSDLAPPEPPPPTLAALKAAAHAQVDARTAEIFAGGYPVASGTLAGETLQCRNNTDRTNWLTSQAAYAAAIAAGAGAVEGASFRTSANRSFTLSFDEGMSVLLAMAAWGQGVYGWAWATKDAIDAAADEPALAAIDLTGGG